MDVFEDVSTVGLSCTSIRSKNVRWPGGDNFGGSKLSIDSLSEQDREGGSSLTLNSYRSMIS